MKHYISLVIAAAAISGVTSCSSDDIPITSDNEGKTILNVQLPAEMTRAFSDGTTAANLYVAVYKAGESTPLFSNFAGAETNDDAFTVTAFDSNLTATVELNLVKNEAYDLVFWAQAPDATAYTFDASMRSINVDYSGLSNFDENRDAFFKGIDGFISTGKGETVVLNRPFAQINIGTSDYDAYLTAAGLSQQEFGMTISECADVLNLSTGEVSGSVQNVTVANSVPNTTETFPIGSEYTYLDMAYVLTGSGTSAKTNVNVTLNVGAEQFETYANVPVQMNYRTNIYGALLTNKEDFTVEIDPSWNTPDYDYNTALIWDGSVAENLPEPENNMYTISTPAELARFAADVNNGKNFKGYTVTLAADINLANLDWTPIGNTTTNFFSGTFDGNGHTISNVKVPTQAKSGSYYGLFGYFNSPTTVQNLNIDGFTAVAGKNMDDFAGAIAADIFTGRVINCHVKNVNIQGNHYSGGITGYSYGVIRDCSATDIVITDDLGNSGDNDKVGGICGMMCEGSGLKIENCTVSNAVLTGSRNIGGIAGMANYESTIANCTVSDTKIYWTSISGNANWESGGAYTNGPIVGRISKDKTILTDNTYTNVTVEKKK